MKVILPSLDQRHKTIAAVTPDHRPNGVNGHAAAAAAEMPPPHFDAADVWADVEAAASYKEQHSAHHQHQVEYQQRVQQGRTTTAAAAIRSPNNRGGFTSSKGSAGTTSSQLRSPFTDPTRGLQETYVPPPPAISYQPVTIHSDALAQAMGGRSGGDNSANRTSVAQKMAMTSPLRQPHTLNY